MVQLLDVTAKRKSYQGWYPGIRKQRTAQRVAKRLNQAIVFINDTFLNYSKDNFGNFGLNKHLWNEGFDHKQIVQKRLSTS